MENASKALIIAGAILISILIIAIGMFIYNNSIGSVEGALTSMDTQEIEASNKQWTNYEGNQKGSQVKSLINKLIANANTNKEETHKIVGLTYEASSTNTGNVYYNTINSLTEFIGNLNTAYTAIQATHTYKVTLTYADNGLITGINVAY